MKKISFLIMIVFTTILFSRCKIQPISPSPDEIVEEFFPPFLLEGHRGARGLVPENTIPSMIKAIEEGANVIELDVHISKDNQVVVTHDPYINPNFSLLPNGEEILDDEAEDYIIYQMDYPDIRKFDVGTKPHKNYTDQKRFKTYIPLLGELIDSVENFTSTHNYPPIIYNIEIKADIEKDGFYQPAPEEYMDIVFDVIKKKNLGNNRYYIQSFDIRQIQQVKKKYPDVVLGFLTKNKELTLEENLERIGFTPQIYSPNFKLATKELIEQSQKHGMKFVPWTVNEKDDMKQLIEMGVDGIITDYPNRLKEIM